MLIQETTDYARPIIFTVETELLEMDQGPELDDSWPTTVKTQVSVCRSRETLLLHCISFVNNINTHYEFIMKYAKTYTCNSNNYIKKILSSFPSGTDVMKMTTVFQTWCYNLRLI